ncbi:MAG: acireductone synthase [Verrucomicrobia bacterium]|nr:acireductone synthase [Verrucomicrobiota bacterium]
MATLRIPAENKLLLEADFIARFLEDYGIYFEQWPVAGRIGEGASAAQILEAYEPEIATLKKRGGYITADVIDVTPDTPNLQAMLDRFNKEHTHAEDEVRFIVEGRGLFHVRPQNGPVFAIEVAAGDLINVMEQVARDAGAISFSQWCPYPWRSAEAVAWVLPTLHEWMDANAKKTGLKALQGLIWAHGYEDGTLKAPLFPDVQPALREWGQQGHTVSIYSSGSIAAQKLFFSHTTQGDITSLLGGYFDTTSGHKQDVESYRTIRLSLRSGEGTPLFFSDVPAELDAAREAGWATALVVRPGNAPVTGTSHPVIHSFSECISG